MEETVPPEEKEPFMSTAEMLKGEGRQEGRAEGRQEGRAEGRKALCDSVLDLLETRFKSVPLSLREAVLRVDDLSQLRRLVQLAAVSVSLDAFAAGL